MTGRALITGAGGFVGKRLAAHLRDTDWEVVCTGYPEGPDMLPCDVTDPKSISDALRAAGEVTHVFHLGAIAFVPDADRDPARAMEVNLNGTIRLCEALRALDNSPRLVFIGSAEAYGAPVDLPVSEAHPLNPANVYSISKAAADHYCAHLSRMGVLDIVRMRPFNHSGPGQSDKFVLSSFARQIAAIEAGHNAPVLRVGNLEASRDFLHVDDVVRAYRHAAIDAPAGAAFNVSSGESHRIGEALDQLLSFTNIPISVEQDPARLRPSDVPEVLGSHDALTAATGWTPAVEFKTLLHELLDYWRQELAAKNTTG
jgi:GDP-4-dehydro-6-deoxy-D-mannose reductase